MSDPLTYVRNHLIAGTPPSSVPENRIIVGRVTESKRISPYTSIMSISGVNNQYHSDEDDDTRVHEEWTRVQISTFAKTRESALAAGGAFTRILESAQPVAPLIKYDYLAHNVVQDLEDEDVWQSILEYRVVTQTSL